MLPIIVGCGLKQLEKGHIKGLVRSLLQPVEWPSKGRIQLLP